ncbi:MAG: hypothetical protein OXC30_06575 [Alphaproteobacteria bacterium]|nr:hypothetical protein [Alphaproteobacteria bacterium]
MRAVIENVLRWVFVNTPGLQIYSELQMLKNTADKRQRLKLSIDRVIKRYMKLLPVKDETKMNLDDQGCEPVRSYSCLHIRRRGISCIFAEVPSSSLDEIEAEIRFCKMFPETQNNKQRDWELDSTLCAADKIRSLAKDRFITVEAQLAIECNSRIKRIHSEAESTKTSSHNRREKNKKEESNL